MKRILIVALNVVIVIFLCACGSNTAINTDVEPVVRKITSLPEVEKTEEVTVKPTVKSNTGLIDSSDDTEDPDKTVEVYIPTKSGTKYHFKSTCSGMKNPQCVSLEYAESNGFTACKKCCK